MTDQPTPRAPERTIPEDPVCGPRSRCRDALHTDGDSHTWRCQQVRATDRHDPETCTCTCAGCNTGAHQACRYDWRLGGIVQQPDHASDPAPEPTAPDDDCRQHKHSQSGGRTQRCDECGRWHFPSAPDDLQREIAEAVHRALFYNHCGEEVFAFADPRIVLGEDEFLGMAAPTVTAAVMDVLYRNGLVK